MAIEAGTALSTAEEQSKTRAAEHLGQPRVALGAGRCLVEQRIGNRLCVQLNRLYLRGTTSPPADPVQAGGPEIRLPAIRNDDSDATIFNGRAQTTWIFRSVLAGSRRKAGYWSMRSERSLKRRTASEIVSSRYR